MASPFVDDKEKFTFFYTSSSPFSQWHPSEFDVDGITFNCCEQFMMYHKASEMNNTSCKVAPTELTSLN
jgi:predicted NAD-dependent protein-ADP-ribosyltransferase YbiA (DUF1768 family)